MRKALRAHGWFALAVPATALLSLLSAPVATAVPTVTSVSCASGNSYYACDLEYANAVGTVTVRWEAYSNGAHLYTAYGKRLNVRRCWPGQRYTFDVFVSDSTGTAQTSTSVICRSGPWE